MKNKISKTKKKEDDTKLFALLGVLLTIIGFLIVLILRKDNKYAMFYAKQGLVLFIFLAIISVFSWLPIIYQIAMLFWIVLWIFGIIYSLSGEEKDIPIIGEFARKINL